VGKVKRGEENKTPREVGRLQITHEKEEEDMEECPVEEEETLEARYDYRNNILY
jgi:hypothetical protein